MNTYRTEGAVAGVKDESRKNAPAGAVRRKLTIYATAAVFPAVLAGGWYYPLLGYFILLCMVAALGMAAKSGRKWCGTLCPRGNFYDLALKPLSPRKKIPAVFRRAPLRAGVLAFLLFMMASQIILRWPDPYSIGKFFVVLLTVTSAVGVVLGLLYQERTWCYICPMGTMSKWIGGAKKPVALESASCKSCKLCQKACPMQLDPSSHKTGSNESAAVLEPDCLKCESCVAACPKKALSLN